MCQRHQNANLIVQQFSDNIYPTMQQLLQQAVEKHGGFDTLDTEQQLIALLISTKDHVAQLIKYDTRLVIPTLMALQHKQAGSTNVNLSEVNFLLKNIVDKINLMTQKALALQEHLPADPANTAIFDFFFYLQQSFLIAYTDRHVFFEEWTKTCRCLKSFSQEDEHTDHHEHETL